MTSELREGLLGSSPAGETGAGEKDPSDEDDEFDDGRVASRGFGGFMRETGRIGIDALPVYAFNVSQFANNILSQAFIGHLGSKELAASALAISYMNVMCQTVNYGLATGQETVVSQANGARRYREVGACLQRGLIVLVVTQLIMSCVSFFGAEILVALGQDEHLAKMAGRYIQLSIPTMWGSGYSTVMCTWLQAQGIFRPVVALGLPGLLVQVAGLFFSFPKFGYLGDGGGDGGVVVDQRAALHRLRGVAGVCAQGPRPPYPPRRRVRLTTRRLERSRRLPQDRAPVV